MNNNTIENSFPVIIKKQRNKQSIRNRPNSVSEHHQRLVSKKGGLNVYLKKLPDKSVRYVRDLWHTLVNMRWRWLMLTVAVVNVAAYLVFAQLFLLDAWISGDFDGNGSSSSGGGSSPKDKVCIRGVHNFTSFLMLGIETITTTGYGYFHPTEYCYLVWAVLTCSTLVTIFIDGAFISVVYAKITRPTHKTSFSIFSKKAVICLRNGKLCLIFRINDRMGQHWINSTVRLFLIRASNTTNYTTLSTVPNYITELKLLPHGMLFWPVDVVHEITPDSPLWDVSAGDLIMHTRSNKFELIAKLTGNSLVTGQTRQSQTSYLNNEILWGFSFRPCLDAADEDGRGAYVVNKADFNRVVLVDTPLCSAKYLRQVEAEIIGESDDFLWMR